jgi:hypothetical protein
MESIPDPRVDITTGYLLIDVANLPELDCEPINLIGCVPPALTNYQELMPCLVAVDEMSLTQRQQLIKMLEYQRASEHAYAICAWLDSDLDIEELAVHIARFLSGPGPEGLPVFWRYFDPRVFATAMALFSPTQRDALLGPVKCWRFVWCRHWWHVKRTAAKSDSLFNHLIGWPTDHQWSKLVQSRVVNQVLEKLGEGVVLAPGDCLQYQQVTMEYLADDAITQHLSEDDKSEFGYLCARYGAAYRRHEKLSRSWDALRRGEISWTEVRFLLDSSDYLRLDAARDPKREFQHGDIRNLRIL